MKIYCRQRREKKECHDVARLLVRLSSSTLNMYRRKDASFPNPETQLLAVYHTTIPYHTYPYHIQAVGFNIARYLPYQLDQPYHQNHTIYYHTIFCVRRTLFCGPFAGD